MNIRSLCLPLLLLLLLFSELSGQNYPDFLVEEKEFLKSEIITPGTFVRTKLDFIYCYGRTFEGPPPDKAGEWNNSIIDSMNDPSNKTLQKKALELFIKAIKEHPRFFPFLYNAARLSYLSNRMKDAVYYFDRARRELPEEYSIYLHLGKSYESLLDERRAIDSYKQSIKLQPFTPVPILALASFYLQREDYAGAVLYYNHVLERWRDHPDALLGMGRMYMKKKDWIKARRVFDQIDYRNHDSTLRDDYDHSLHFFMAVVCAELRDYAAAVRHYDLLLTKPDHIFFLENPRDNILRRRELVRRLAENEKNE